AGGGVVGERAGVGGAFVPDHDVVVLPPPPALHIRVVETAAQETQQRVALVVGEAGDPAHGTAPQGKRGAVPPRGGADPPGGGGGGPVRRPAGTRRHRTSSSWSLRSSVRDGGPVRGRRSAPA